MRIVERLLRRRAPGPDPDPGTPHAFRPIDDAGLGFLAAGGVQPDRGSGQFTMVAMTDNYIRKSRCGVPGCGRERSDPIHQVQD
jgi:hypothetical protein